MEFYNGPVSLLIEHALLITMDEQATILNDGAMVVHDGKIVAIMSHGVSDDLLTDYRMRADEVIDAGGRLVMPGLVNTHCHAGDSLFRGLVEGLPLEPWLEKLWIAESAILNPETIELGALLGYGENLLGGVTTVMDMFWEPASLLKAAQQTGISVATGGLFFDPPGIDGITADKREDLADGFFKDHKGHPNLIPTVSAHGAYTVSPKSLKTALKVQEAHNALITIHAAETRAEQKIVCEQYGKSVIRHLDEVGFLSPKTILAHCVHIDEHEMEILARTKASVSHNPASNLKLGSGIAPIPTMMEKGVRVALGTDGAVSGNDLDMWKSIRLAAILHNGANENALAMDAQSAISMATLTGARALHIEHQVGSLETGKRADFIILNQFQAHSIPIFNPINYLAYAASHQDVEDVFVNGVQVVKGKKLLTIDLDTVIERVKALTPKIAATLPS